MPDVLKVQLVDDWEYVTKNQQVRLHLIFFTENRRLNTDDDHTRHLPASLCLSQGHRT